MGFNLPPERSLKKNFVFSIIIVCNLGALKPPEFFEHFKKINTMTLLSSIIFTPFGLFGLVAVIMCFYLVYIGFNNDCETINDLFNGEDDE